MVLTQNLLASLSTLRALKASLMAIFVFSGCAPDTPFTPLPGTEVETEAGSNLPSAAPLPTGPEAETEVGSNPPSATPPPTGPVAYVDRGAIGIGDGSSWFDAYTDLKEAIDQSASVATAETPVQIWVKAGSYVPAADGNRSQSFTLRNHVEVYGGFPASIPEPSFDQRDTVAHETILSGDLLSNDLIGDGATLIDNSYHVVYSSAVGPSAKLDGFTITGGNADPKDEESVTTFNASGGGMLVGGSPVLKNLHFTRNSATYVGGGMANTRGNPVLTNIAFTENISGAAGGGMVNFYGKPILTNVTFRGNHARSVGGGFYQIAAKAHPVLTNATFIGNTARGQGGGMGIQNSNATLTNVTFTGNSPVGLRIDNSSLVITNGIFWGNTTDNIRILWEASSSIVLTHTATEQVREGTGNIPLTESPFVAEPSAGADGEWGTDDDVLPELKEGSPCIDAGNNEAELGYDVDGDGITDPVSALTTDLLGNARLVDIVDSEDAGNAGGSELPIIDLGAYEAQ